MVVVFMVGAIGLDDVMEDAELFVGDMVRADDFG